LVESTSLSQYDKSVLKRAYDAEIRPSFTPCDHGFEPCTQENCSCVQSALLCTKHCVLGPYSKNFFRGCACKAGGCRTVQCSCFALGRECDPDICVSCGTCTDPPMRRAVTQQCRNDNVSMRRHCHLLIGPSTVPDAGWGVFTKHDLKKGDFVHEYIGESISQEEAERRGVVYDKINRSYLFNICSDLVLDAAKKGCNICCLWYLCFLFPSYVSLL
jgi:histone-lysine N-methyltransferase EZH2